MKKTIQITVAIEQENETVRYIDVNVKCNTLKQAFEHLISLSACQGVDQVGLLHFQI